MSNAIFTGCIINVFSGVVQIFQRFLPSNLAQRGKLPGKLVMLISNMTRKLKIKQLWSVCAVTSSLCRKGSLKICHYHIQNGKNSCRLHNADVSRLQTIMKMYTQLYITSTMACPRWLLVTLKLGIFGFSLLLMTHNYKVVSGVTTPGSIENGDDHNYIVCSCVFNLSIPFLKS